MKIGVIHLGFFYAGGGERLVLEEVRGLRQLGHEVECFAPIVDPEACYPELIREVGVRSLLPRPPSWLPGRVALSVLLACILSPLLALRLRRFDVLLAANQPSAWIAWVISRVLHKPYVAYLAFPNRVLYPRPVDLQVNRPNLDYQLFALVARIARPFVAWADRVSVAGAAAVLANGTYIKEVLERVYKRPMIPCPAGSHPVPAEEIDLKVRMTGELHVGNFFIPKPYVLLTNRHYPQKRFDYAVKALPSLPDAVLVVTGARTGYTAEMEALAAKLGVGNRVIFTGLRSDGELARLYSEAAVYVYPAPEEDYGMGIVEAMGHGVPTVAWRSAGPTSSVVDGETGFLVEPFHQDTFARRIALLLANPELAERMGRAAWLHVNNGLAYPGHFRTLEKQLVRALDRASSPLAVPSPLRGGKGRGFLRPAFQTGFGLLLLAIWAKSLPLGDVWQHARPRHLAPLAGIFLLSLLSGLLRAERWRLLLRPLTKLRTADIFWVNAGSNLLNYLIPVRAGDATRIWWLSRRHHVPAGSGVATILVDKTFDLGAVALVLGLSALLEPSVFGRPLTPGLGIAALGASGLLALAVAVAVLGPRMAGWPTLAGRLPDHWRTVLTGHAFSFRAGARGSLGGKRVAVLAALSLVALAIDGVAFSLLFAALDIHLPLTTVVVGYVALLLSYVLPAAPGYVGSLEVAGSVVLSAGMGLDSASAAGAIVFWHAFTSALVLTMGLLGLNRLRQEPVPADRPRRIAVFHYSFTYSGGGERIVLEEVLGLRKLGFEVECFAPTVDARACYPEMMASVGVRTFLPQLPAWVPLRNALQMAACSLLVSIYAWRFKSFDVIIGANQPGIWIAWWVARLLGKPHLAYLNQPNRLIYPRPIDLETGWQANPDYHLLNLVIQRMRGFVAWADRRSVREAAELLVNGRYIGDIIRRTYGRDAIDCPAGCHVDEGYPLPLEKRFSGQLIVNGYRIRKPYVLLTNRHYPQKRFDLAIRAMVDARSDHPGVQLVIPGPPTSHTEELRRLVAELDLKESVLFLGQISEGELQRLYAEAAVYVYPAPEEDFGMGVIESMARGVPVVAWNHAGPTVTVTPGETGYLARLGDVGDYARGIAQYLTDPERNQEVGRRAHTRARLFTWERHVAILEAAVANALDERKRQELSVSLPLVGEKGTSAFPSPLRGGTGRGSATRDGAPTGKAA